ncbi:MAG: hypothetical protein AAB930_02975 [Patescibacteria group bacterium]
MNQKGFIPIAVIITVIVILVASGGAVLIYQKSVTRSPEIQSSPSDLSPPIAKSATSEIPQKKLSPTQAESPETSEGQKPTTQLPPAPLEKMPPPLSTYTPPLNPASTRSPIFGTPCTSNPKPVFEHPFAPVDHIAGIIPPGAAASEEIKPHSYVEIDTTLGESIPVYAPADMYLVQGAFYKEPSTFRVPTSYILHFMVSCEITINLDHITDPVDKIKTVLNQTPQDDTRMESILKNPVYFKAGELIGSTKGGGVHGINRFDFGLYNTTHTNQFVNQRRYEQSYNWKSINAVCPYDSFAPEVKDMYLKKFRTFEKPTLVPGASCRIPNQDKAGTLSGAWFLSEDSSSVEPHVGIALEINGQEITIVGIRNMSFSIDDSNPTFEDPRSVTTEHCYFDPLNGARVLYFKLHSPIKVEVWDGDSSSGCPNVFPTSGTIFLYR